jgi:hypothetical protein
MTSRRHYISDYLRYVPEAEPGSGAGRANVWPCETAEESRFTQAIAAKSCIDVAFYYGLPVPAQVSQLGGTDAEAEAEIRDIRQRLDGQVIYREFTTRANFGLAIDTGGATLWLTKTRDTEVS